MQLVVPFWNAGTVTWICVPLGSAANAEAATPPTVTLVAPLKPAPKTSTVLPPASGPAYVCTPVTVGSGCEEPLSSTKVNQLFTLAALVSPSFSVTVTCTRPAPSVGSCGEVKERPGGIVAVIVVGLVTVNDPEESSA